MNSGPYTLQALRENVLGYGFDAVVRFSGVERDRLVELEAGRSEPTAFEAFALGRTYGIDPELLAEPPVKLAKGDAVEALALQDEFHDLADEVRYRVVRAANAARDLKRLRDLANHHTGVGLLPRLTSDRHNAPFRQGGKHAAEIRTRTKIGAEPIPSMRDFVATYFPAIAVLYANLTPEGPAGITFADRVRGPTIVINLDGKNVNPGVRRFSLAHELCHVLADWSRRKPLALLSGFLSESGLEVEQRANGFAVRLICPESHIHKIKQTSTPTEIRDEIAPFGLHYSALRLYLHKEANVKLSPRVSPELAGIGTEERWRLAEAPDGVERFPLDEVRPERRTLVAQTAATLYSDGKISRRAFAELLGVSPILDVEVVIDHFGLDRPDEDE